MVDCLSTWLIGFNEYKTQLQVTYIEGYAKALDGVNLNWLPIEENIESKLLN